MHKGFIKTAAFTGAIAVALGAFGAHSLKKIVTTDVLAVFETAVRYQFYHVFALLAVGILYASWPGRLMKWAGYCFICGIILFCGSLYLLCCIKHLGLDMEWVGAITPFGGMAFITGWIALVIAAFKKH